jgi:hypothetical protein
VTGALIVGDHGQCPGMVCASGTESNAAMDGKALLVPNAIAWGVGLAGVAAGTTLLVLSYSHRGGTLGVSAHAGAGGLVVRGAF